MSIMKNFADKNFGQKLSIKTESKVSSIINPKGTKVAKITIHKASEGSSHLLEQTSNKSKLSIQSGSHKVLPAFKSEKRPIIEGLE